MTRARLLSAVLCVLWGCAAPAMPPEESRREAVPTSAVLRVRAAVQDDLARYVAAEESAVREALAGAATMAARSKRRAVVDTLRDPWVGLGRMEGEARQLGVSVQDGRPDLSRVIGLLAHLTGHPSEATMPVPMPSERTSAVQVGYLVTLLEQATGLRERALRRLSATERRFLYRQAGSLVDTFSAQVSEPSKAVLAQAQTDARFVELAERLDTDALVAAAQVLASLADPAVLKSLEHAFGSLPAPVRPPLGVSGEVRLVRETALGLIVIGGAGPNVYQLDRRFALVLDLGGDDQYLGEIAAPGDAERGVSVVIDLAGNDRYHPTTLGLATGRLGLGLLVDRAGNDTYELADGAGGTGFAGIGVLYDLAGDDRYQGTRLTQGAAFAGLGLLLDTGGHDAHTSFGYAIGFGGPLGTGAVIDVAGDDRYQCGGKYPSSDNAQDAPGARPGDPQFQHDAFGIGAGAGKRLYLSDAQQRSYSLAGGVGLVLDLSGNDTYESSNFSQGVGYFFGAGMKLDLAGHDEHQAARYGHGAAAHAGVGLHVDDQGDDRYTSSGPFYNGGAAWELSVALAVDAGQGNDVYDLRRSDGLGRAAYLGWSLFADDGGGDRYLVGAGLGRVTNGGMSGFFDLAGEDEYAMAGRGNGQVATDGAGGLFVDR